VGFALLIPPVRSAAYRYVRARVRVQSFQMGGRPDPRTQARPAPADPNVIEGEYKEVTPPKRPTHGSSGWTRH